MNNVHRSVEANVEHFLPVIRRRFHKGLVRDDCRCVDHNIDWTECCFGFGDHMFDLFHIRNVAGDA